MLPPQVGRVAVSGEPPQGYADLLRLLTAVQATVVDEPAARATRALLLEKLSHLAEHPEVFRAAVEHVAGVGVGVESPRPVPPPFPGFPALPATSATLAFPLAR